MATAGSPSRPRLLFLESGRGPGGSVNFIRDFVLHMDPAAAEPVIGVYHDNPSSALREIRNFRFSVTFFASAPASHRPEGRFAKLFDARLKRLRPLRTIMRLARRWSTTELPLTWKVWRFIKKECIDVVVLNQDMHFHIPGVLAAKLAGVPCICRKAGGIGEARRLKRLLTPWIDLFVSISKATEADQRANLKTKRLLTIYEGLDLARFAAAPSREVMRKQLGLPDGKKVVASISRVEQGKGQVEFIKMAAAIREQNPGVVFLIVGDEGPDGGGALMAELKDQVRRADIERDVVFAGWREDIPAIMSAVDIFVHCPTTFIEGLARTCLEAMAMRIPSVVSDNGGMSDAVLDGVTGFVVPPGDIQAMTRAVLRLLEDQQLSNEFGQQARMRVEQAFDMAQNARKLQHVLLEYVSAPPCSAEPKVRRAGAGVE